MVNARSDALWVAHISGMYLATLRNADVRGRNKTLQRTRTTFGHSRLTACIFTTVAEIIDAVWSSGFGDTAVLRYRHYRHLFFICKWFADLLT